MCLLMSGTLVRKWRNYAETQECLNVVFFLHWKDLKTKWLIFKHKKVLGLLTNQLCYNCLLFVASLLPSFQFWCINSFWVRFSKCFSPSVCARLSLPTVIFLLIHVLIFYLTLPIRTMSNETMCCLKSLLLFIQKGLEYYLIINLLL